MVSVDTGCRLQEVLRVERDNVRQHANDMNTLTIWQSKSGRARTLPLTRRAGDILAKRLAGNEHDFSDLTAPRAR